VAAVTAPLTEDTYVYLKDPGDGTLYTGDFDMQGVRAIGGEYKLIIQPAPTLWDQDKYEAGEEDPFGGSGGFNPSTATFPIKVQLTLEIRDCTNIELRGLWFYATSSAASSLKLMMRTDVNACYCRFEGALAGVVAMMNSFFDSENCYYKGCNVGVLALYDSLVHLAGDTYLVNPITSGVHVGARSHLVVRATPDYPDHNTLYVTTTLPRIKDFAALKAAASSTICIQDESVLPLNMSTAFNAFVKIHHANVVQAAEYYCVALEDRSTLTGAARLRCTTINLKSETVAMARAHWVAGKSGQGNLVVL